MKIKRKIVKTIKFITRRIIEQSSINARVKRARLDLLEKRKKKKLNLANRKGAKLSKLSKRKTQSKSQRELFENERII